MFRVCSCKRALYKAYSGAVHYTLVVYSAQCSAAFQAIKIQNIYPWMPLKGLYMGRNLIRQHFLALSVVFLGGFKQLQLLDYCIYVQKVKFPVIIGLTPWSGCLQTQNLLPGNVCRKRLKFPEILLTINEAYLFALSTTVTLTYIPVMTPGLLDMFPGAS